MRVAGRSLGTGRLPAFHSAAQPCKKLPSPFNFMDLRYRIRVYVAAFVAAAVTLLPKSNDFDGPDCVFGDFPRPSRLDSPILTH